MERRRRRRLGAATARARPEPSHNNRSDTPQRAVVSGDKRHAQGRCSVRSIELTPLSASASANSTLSRKSQTSYSLTRCGETDGSMLARSPSHPILCKSQHTCITVTRREPHSFRSTGSECSPMAASASATQSFSHSSGSYCSGDSPWSDYVRSLSLSPSRRFDDVSRHMHPTVERQLEWPSSPAKTQQTTESPVTAQRQKRRPRHRAPSSPTPVTNNNSPPHGSVSASLHITRAIWKKKRSSLTATKSVSQSVDQNSGGLASSEGRGGLQARGRVTENGPVRGSCHSTHPQRLSAELHKRPHSSGPSLRRGELSLTQRGGSHTLASAKARELILEGRILLDSLSHSETQPCGEGATNEPIARDGAVEVTLGSPCHSHRGNQDPVGGEDCTASPHKASPQPPSTSSGADGKYGKDGPENASAGVGAVIAERNSLSCSRPDIKGVGIDRGGRSPVASTKCSSAPSTDGRPIPSSLYSIPRELSDEIFLAVYQYCVTPEPSLSMLADVRDVLVKVEEVLESEWKGLYETLVAEISQERAKTGELLVALQGESHLEVLSRLRAFEEFLEFFSLASIVRADVVTTENFRICLLAAMESNGPALLSNLTPFACYLAAKAVVPTTLISTQKELVGSFLEKSVGAHAATAVFLASPTDVQRTMPVRTVLPLTRGTPLYLYEAWFRLGRVLDWFDANGEEYPTSSLMTSLTSNSASSASPSLLCFKRSLEFSNGNYAPSWHSAGFALRHSSEALEVLGERVPQVQCFAEVVRCRGGLNNCKDDRLWRDAVGYLRSGHLPSPLSTPRGPSSNGGRLSIGEQHMLVTSLVNEPFTYSLRGRHPFCQVVDKKRCLLYCLRCASPPGEKEDWLELGMQLKMSTTRVVSDGVPRLEVREEKVDINGTEIGRMDCFARALAIDPMAGDVWYRAALSMEDHVRLANEKCIAVRDVYERQLLGPRAPAVDRVKALAYGLLATPRDYRLWFALGTTLFERNFELHQPKEWVVKVPQVEDGASVVHHVQAVDCFAVCRRLRPSMKGVIEGWIARELQLRGATSTR